MKYYVVDIQVTEQADTTERAREIAECWIEEQRDICRDADDETLSRWLHSGSRGLDAGDVEIWECEDDADTRFDGECIEAYDGRAVTEEVAAERGIE